MSTADPDLTLPAVIPAAAGNIPEHRLVLTIIFHPDPARIGETALLPSPAGSRPRVLGRRSPAFSRAAGSPGIPLQEAHVSRQALALEGDAAQLTIRRLPKSSRCRVGGRELDDSVELNREQLQRGVPILLGHSVVLLLRLARWTEPREVPAVLAGLRGSSAYMVRLREQLLSLAASGLDVLVRGETGTGKELVATAIHRASARGKGPMVSVNMAAVPPGLAAAMLFGSARGAFTGASQANPGYFCQARGGTLLLDEIGDTPAEIQPQLLRALQEREVQAVGGAIHKVDVRVISATDAPLENESCDFKAALRYRLGAGEVELLPLREHPEDIGELLMHFLACNCRQLGRTQLLPGPHTPAREIAAWADLFHRFLGYDWPGNVRELANFASQVVLASGAGPAVPDSVRQALQAAAPGPSSRAAGARGDSPNRNIRDVSEQEFHSALQNNGYEVANAARQLGVSRQAIYRRMDQTPRYRLAGQVPLAELEQALALRGGDASAVARDLEVSLSSLRARLRDTTLEWF